MRTLLALLALVLALPVASACDGLSPGDAISTDEGGCTLAFLVAAPDGLYFATAGHCVQVDQVVSNPDHGDIGVGAFHFLEPETGSNSDGSPGFDFGLIRIDPALYDQLNPKVCGWDGPTGVYRDTPGEGGVKHWGHGLLFGDLGPAGQRREGFGLQNDNTAFYWYGAGVPGDSGSAVLADDGRALGVLTHLQIGGSNTNGGTHLDRGFSLAAEEGFTELRLVLMGEDPLEVLREVQAAAAANATKPPTKATPTATPTTATPKPTPSPTSGTNATNDSIVPAATAGDDDKAPVPFAPTWGVLALAAGAAAARRARQRR